jgi:CRISPR-associated endonuclease/helicase Cas3
MLPVPLLQPCITALRELCANYGSTAVLCTATQPALHRSPALPCGFAEDEVREIVPAHAELHQVFRRVDVTHLGPLADDQVVARITDENQALCIVNTRAQAAKLFAALGADAGNFHLSALMCPAHRAVVLAQIRARLTAGQVCRVVSTQLIEAGVDVDFPVVLRAASGVDSVAQAAGRCNREGRLPGRGQVWVFDPECGLPPGHFRRVAQVGAMVARTHAADVLAPEAVREYFSELYFFEGADGLDREGILPLLREGAPSLSFPFREIAEKFRIIADGMETLIVPYRPPCIPREQSEVEALMNELRDDGPSASLARQLQQYTVQVWPRTLAGLLAAGVVETVADAFLVLTNDSIYRDDLGLCPDDPTFRNQEDNVF